MDQHASAAITRRPLLVFSRANFDDYWTALLADVRSNDVADQVYTGAIAHPLFTYQLANQADITALGIPILPADRFDADPMGLYDSFHTQMRTNNAALDEPAEPALPGLDELRAQWTIYRQGQRTLFSRTVATLRISNSMHYARGVPFGAGTLLLANILSDNRRNTTTSLMAVFTSLLTLRLAASETYSSISNRVDLMTSRLRSWVPPIVLPGQLVLCCLLTALPDIPYGPIRHIILSRPDITFEDGSRMLRDVAQSSASVATARGPTSSAVMSARAEPEPTSGVSAADVTAMVAAAIAAAGTTSQK